MQPRDSEIRLEPDLEARGLDHHPRLLGHHDVGGAGGQDPDAAVDGVGRETGLKHPHRRAICADLQMGAGGRARQGFLVGVGHPAHQALALPFGHGDGEGGRVLGRLALGQDHLGDAAA